MLFGSFDRVTQFGRAWTSPDLTFKDRRRIGGDQFVPLQNELGINSIARRLVNLVAAEIAVEFVFVVVVAAELEPFAIRRQFLFFIEHDQLRGTPRLDRKSTRLNSSHRTISYAVFCLK